MLPRPCNRNDVVVAMHVSRRNGDETMPATQSQHKKAHLCSQLPTQRSRREMRHFAVAAVVPARPATFLLLGEARRCARCLQVPRCSVCERYCGSKPRRCPQQEGQRMCQACGKWYLQTKSSHAEVLTHACCQNCASRGFHYKCGRCSLLKQREAFQLTPNLQRHIQRRKCDACRAEDDKAFLLRCTQCEEEKSKAAFSRLSAITLHHKDQRVCDECHAKEPLFRCTQCEEKKSRAAFFRLSAITLHHKDKRVCDECHAKEPLFRCTQCEEEKSRAAFFRLSARTFSHTKKRVCDECHAKEPLFRCTQCGEEQSKAAFSKLSAQTFRHTERRVCDECQAKEPLFRCTHCEEHKRKAAFSNLAIDTFRRAARRICDECNAEERCAKCGQSKLTSHFASLSQDAWKRATRKLCDTCHAPSTHGRAKRSLAENLHTDGDAAKRSRTAQCPRVEAPTPMQVEASSTQMASNRRAAELPFFQQQTGSECGLTALNNALQEARFTTESMQAAADAYLRALEGIDEDRGEHISDTGWYSVQVLYTALFSAGYTLDIDNPINTPASLENCIGCIQNWQNTHWVAYIMVGEEIFLCDSLKPRPEKISAAALAATLPHCPTYAIRA